MPSTPITDQLSRYANGEQFENLLVVPITQHGTIRSREAVIRERIVGKRILHIGCLDHVPLIAEKIAAGTWLHQILTKASDTCLGLDIDQSGIDLVRSEYGFENIVYADLISGDGSERFRNEYWDYAVFGEVLEHIENPVQFLSRFLELTEGRVGSVLVTVPNAFRRANWLGTLRSREKVNSDHLYWFTPYTLCRVLNRAGWKTRSIEHCEFGESDRLSTTLKRSIIRHLPMLAEDLVAVADGPMIQTSQAAA